MSKIESNKKQKEESLLDAAFTLFTSKGINKTSISDIVAKSGVAKGTFYLYFKDKYEIRDVLIAKKSHKLFNDALQELRKKEIKTLSERVIFIVNYVVDELTKAPTLLKFISKNLSWGVYNKTVLKIYERTENEEEGLYHLFLKEVNENNIKLENPEVTLFMIIELVSSTCFNSILYDEPLPIEEYKPYLYDTIKRLIEG